MNRAAHWILAGLVFWMGLLTGPGVEASTGLVVKGGATVDVGGATVTLNCLDLTVENGGTMNLGGGAVLGIGRQTVHDGGQLNEQGGTLSLGDCTRLVVQKSGDGSGTVTSLPPRIECGGSCEALFPAGGELRLSASADAGSAFEGWSLEGSGFLAECPGNGDCAFTLGKRNRVVIAAFGPDGDSDGISDATEDAGPNDGDGDGNGLKDSQEPNVATFPSIDCGWFTLVSETGTRLEGTSFEGNPSQEDAPTDVDLPRCFSGFTVQGLAQGASTVVSLLMHDRDDSVVRYMKYGPTPDNPDDHWYPFPYDGETGARLLLDMDPVRVLLHFDDGLRGDDDLLENGSVTDIGGPARKPSEGAVGDGGSGGCFLQTVSPGQRR